MTVTDQTVAPAGGPSRSADDAVKAVARGGALNLVGSVIYGAANFGLLVVLNRVLGAASAGIVVVAITLFSVSETICEAGSATGLIRMISRHRALDEAEEIPATVKVAVVPVVMVSVVLAVVLYLCAHPLADLLSDGHQTATVARILQAMAPFLPFYTLQSVVVQATRGFDTMKPQVFIERVGRALSLPIVVGIAVAIGMGPVGVGVAWAATNVVALVFSTMALRGRVHRAVDATGRLAPRVTRRRFRSYWGFTLPRAVGQTAETAVNWIDTLIVSAVVSTTAAGIYASGTRYLLPGLYAAEALMQVTGPRISGLLSRGEKAEASHLLKIVAGWQTAVMWPIYLLTALFPTPLLLLFNKEAVEARGALVALSIAMLIAAPAGPVASVILMAGRSTQAMVNTIVLVVINVGGNLLLVPHFGITSAGIVWGVTILVAALLPGWQANRSLDVGTLGWPAFVAAALAAGTVGAIAGITRVIAGDNLSGLAIATSLGGLAYLVGLRLLRSHLHLDALWNGIRRRS